ncbi:MAG: protein kinase [Planctomycetes bacterium]|nr:protein kinase [Planctomycetota bacterium]
MSPERFRRLRNLFDAAVGLPPPEWRSTLLAIAPDDPELVDEACAFLAQNAGDETEFMLRVRGATVAALDDALTESRPERIGPYRIRRVLGEGGMGTVFLADQTEPVRRQVALKVIKLGMDSRAVLSRFDAERQFLAMMEHAGIAKIFEAGLTEAGQPYFAMEFVAGDPITAYCDRQRLGIPERLRLFRAVCAAVNHAHDKGVVHRDLKPGNVLVAVEDREPVPKVIDFGLAKAIDPAFAGGSLATEHGALLGTPDYIAPEQAAGGTVDARTDVFSLGVLLYELLVGSRPFEQRRGAATATAASWAGDPRPSSRVRRLGEAANERAALRQVTARDLERRLRGDLDSIVGKAIELDPDLRYASASELAADIDRYLRREPVLATAPGAVYRLRRFVQRRRVQVVAGLAVAVAVLVSGAATVLATRGESESAARRRIDADAALLREAQRLEAKLYPALPELVAPMRAWLANYGDPLERRRPELAGQLAAMRARAHERGAAATDAELERLRDELQRLRTKLEGENRAVRRRQHEEDIRRLEAEIAAAHLECDTPADTEVLLHLTKLVSDLDGFAQAGGLLTGVRARLAVAEVIEERTVDDYAIEWSGALAAIASPTGSYAGLRIAPQIGFVPIGEDPDSKLWEFVHFASAAHGRTMPRRDPDTGRVVPDGDMGIVFVLVPGGTLPGDESRSDVVLEPFFLSKYELTAGQQLRLAGERTGDGSGSDLAMPAHSIDWFQCQDLLAPQGLELPREQQWEYACRAGTTSEWWCGSRASDLAGHENVGAGRIGRLLRVGSLAPNAFGLFDMAGNVSEWCGDGIGDGTAGDYAAVTCGGSCDDPAACAGSSHRQSWPRTEQHDRIGLRPACRIRR